MNDRRFRGMVRTLALGTSLAALPVLAQHDPHGGQGGAPMHRRMALPAIHILHELDLSTEQRDQIHSIVRRYHEDGLPARVEAVQQARQAHLLSVWDPKASDAELGSTADAVADRARDVDAVLHRMAAEILGVLTEDQRAEFRTRLSETPDGPDGPPMSPHSMPRQSGPGTPER